MPLAPSAAQWLSRPMLADFKEKSEAAVIRALEDTAAPGVRIIGTRQQVGKAFCLVGAEASSVDGGGGLFVRTRPPTTTPPPLTTTHAYTPTPIYTQYSSSPPSCSSRRSWSTSSGTSSSAPRRTPCAASSTRWCVVGIHVCACVCVVSLRVCLSVCPSVSLSMCCFSLSTPNSSNPL